MKIAIYSPYLDTAGGGEKYMLSIAQILSENHSVDVLLNRNLSKIGAEKISEKNSFLHKLDLSKINFINAPVGIGSSFFQRYLFLRNYDWLIYNGDGSIFYSSAKNGLIHFQVPFQNQAAKSIWGKIKLATFKSAIYNSQFTKQIIESSWPIKGQVLYPPVNVEIFKKSEKKKQILSVGRFFGYLNPKKQDVLISIFKNMHSQKKLTGWSLHLAGSASEGDLEFVENLKNLAKGFDIKFYPNISLDELIKLYSQSSIYWHAMGFEEEDPKKFEHFGISTVEAMASGCVPVVISKGGQKEIVEDGKSGFLWETIEECQEKTLKLIGNQNLYGQMSKEATMRSKEFSFTRFKDKLLEIINAKE